MNDRRTLLLAMFDAAVAAAHPDTTLTPYLPPKPTGRIICLAAGKGAAAMASVAENFYLDSLGLPSERLVGLATTRYGHGVSTRCVEVVESGHPYPDRAGLRSADRTLALAAEARPSDLVLVLLSGGGSANWIAPVDGLTFEQKRDVSKALLKSGAAIDEINIVRRHLSRIKGGRLARAARHAEAIVTLAISDVPLDNHSAIASGPTVPDPTTLADARAVLSEYDIAVDPAVRRALSDQRNESCKAGDVAFARARFEMIARPRQSLDAAVRLAKEAGYKVIDLGADVQGEAREVARDHARIAMRARASGVRTAILSGGELTVTVRGTGRGGPNQEYALALAGWLAEMNAISVLAADTDGADGGLGRPTDPSGAMIDAVTVARAAEQGLDLSGALDNNDATSFFEATGSLIFSGPTLTNVNDIRAILVD